VTFVTSALGLCRAALKAGLDFSGTQLTVTGEPMSEAGLSLIRRTGAEAVPYYGSSESGFIGYGCLSPEAPDDQHLFDDLHALIQLGPNSAVQGLPNGALLLSSLRPGARFIVLNLSLGDRAVVTARPCGCPLEARGWLTHLHTIRSFEKLTAGGAGFHDADVISVLEEVLPARFGGGPRDYQLLEEQAEGEGYGSWSIPVLAQWTPVRWQMSSSVRLDPVPGQNELGASSGGRPVC
jgi:hypothetical protein